jgi:hypothetical protein
MTMKPMTEVMARAESWMMKVRAVICFSFLEVW